MNKRIPALVLIAVPLTACSPWEYITIIREPITVTQATRLEPAAEGQEYSVLDPVPVFVIDPVVGLDTEIVVEPVAVPEPVAEPVAEPVPDPVTAYHEIACGEGDEMAITDVGTVPGWREFGCVLTGRVHYPNPA